MDLRGKIDSRGCKVLKKHRARGILGRNVKIFHMKRSDLDLKDKEIGIVE